MRRREFLKYTAATAVAAPFVRAARADSGVVKVGVVGAKTGPLAPGAAVTHFPPYQLWAHEVNERGGLKLKSGAAKIQLIEYDDRTQPPEAIKAVERLATVDKADWIGGNYSAQDLFEKYFTKEVKQKLYRADVCSSCNMQERGPLLCRRMTTCCNAPTGSAGPTMGSSTPSGTKGPDRTPTGKTPIFACTSRAFTYATRSAAKGSFSTNWASIWLQMCVSPQATAGSTVSAR